MVNYSSNKIVDIILVLDMCYQN